MEVCVYFAPLQRGTGAGHEYKDHVRAVSVTCRGDCLATETLHYIQLELKSCP